MESLSIVNFHKICRICFSEVYGPDEAVLLQKVITPDDKNLKDIFEICTSIQANEDLPGNLCKKCSEDLLSCYNFICKCKLSDNILKTALALDTSKRMASLAQISQPSFLDTEKPIVIKEPDIEDIEETNAADYLEQLCEVKDSFTSEFHEMRCQPGPSDTSDVLKMLVAQKQNHIESTRNKYRPKPMVCSFCQKELSSAHALNYHIRSAHPDEERHTCPTCSMTFVDKIFLLKHQQIHEENRPFVCEICSKAYKTKISLKQHLVCHSADKPFQCNFCAKRFQRAHHLRKHQVTLACAQPFACEVCGKTFNLDSRLTEHIYQHIVSDCLKCDLCNVKFKNSNFFRVHMKGHNVECTLDDIEEGATNKMKCYNCTMCNDWFTSEKTLYVHKKYWCGKTLLCGVCGKNCHMEAALKIHMKVHTDERLYTCELCGKSFQTDRRFRLHKSLHDAVNPYTCTICNENFEHLHQKRLHMRSHTQQKKVENNGIVK